MLLLPAVKEDEGGSGSGEDLPGDRTGEQGHHLDWTRRRTAGNLEVNSRF